MLRAEAASAGPAGFRHAHPHALLVGVGIVPVTLPDPEDEGTLLLDEGQLNVDEVAQSRAIQGRVFWIKPASGEPLGSSGNLRVTLGRERHCDVVLPDFPVSGLHCWFVLNDACERSPSCIRFSYHDLPAPGGRRGPSAPRPPRVGRAGQLCGVMMPPATGATICR